MSQEESGEDRASPTVKTYLLNSRRLTAEIVSMIARGLSLPTAMSQADIRQMIEGTLAETHDKKMCMIGTG